MSKLTPDPHDRPGGPAPFQAGPDGTPADIEPDFGGEHSHTSYADDLEGGPEAAPDPDSPRGSAGMD